MITYDTKEALIEMLYDILDNHPTDSLTVDRIKSDIREIVDFIDEN